MSSEEADLMNDDSYTSSRDEGYTDCTSETDDTASSHDVPFRVEDIQFESKHDEELTGFILENLNSLDIIVADKLVELVKSAASKSDEDAVWKKVGNAPSKYKSDEVTFDSVSDIFESVSEARREIGLRRGGTLLPREDVKTNSTTTGRHLFPLDALLLVAEQILQDQAPLGVEAMDPWWKDAFARNGATFRSMSLVHRSWTVTAQHSLRRRAIVPFQHIKKFLINPLCGPWIKEMIIYWTPDEGHTGIKEQDVVLLNMLLSQTPKLRSLAFNTMLVWRRFCHKTYKRPALCIDDCLETIADNLPDLENLWLKHFDPLNSLPEERERDDPSYSLMYLKKVGPLCMQIPEMHSLKFLSLRSWSLDMKKQASLTMDKHPPPNLKTIELDLHGTWGDNPSWLLKPRGDYRLQSLAILIRDDGYGTGYFKRLFQYIKDCLPKLKKLQLCWLKGSTEGFRKFCRAILANANELTTLELFFMTDPASPFDFSSVRFPTTLKIMVLHYDDKTIQKLFSSESNGSFAKQIKGVLELEGLQRLVITSSPTLSEDKVDGWDLDGYIHHMVEDAKKVREGIPEDLVNACNAHNIRLAYVKDAFPRQWYVPEVHTGYFF